jgi:hypothetical protein
MHMKGSDRIITPPEEPAPDEARSTREGSHESDLSVDPAKLFPSAYPTYSPTPRQAPAKSRCVPIRSPASRKPPPASAC